MNDAASHNPGNGPSADLVRKVELLISNLLRIGVISSLIIVIIGLIVCFLHHPDYLHSAQMQQVISPSHPTWDSLRELFHGMRHLRGQAIIMAGLLLLIATPVMRVAVSIAAFIFERDFIFVVVTSFVLAMLILSFVLGRVEG